MCSARINAMVMASVRPQAAVFATAGGGARDAIWNQAAQVLDGPMAGGYRALGTARATCSARVNATRDGKGWHAVSPGAPEHLLSNHIGHHLLVSCGLMLLVAAPRRPRRRRRRAGWPRRPASRCSRFLTPGPRGA